MISRQALKRHLPGGLRRGLLSLRDRLNGPGLEADVLHDTRFAADDAPGPRISFVMPGLSARETFGGVATALALAAELKARLEPQGVAFRMVADRPVDPGDNPLDRHPALAGTPVWCLAQNGYRLPLRAREICLVYNWWVSLNLDPARAAQARHFGQPPRPKIHLIQDYEPQFYAFSTVHLLAREAVSGPGLWAVFNSSELFAYWQRQGHAADRTYVFEPRMNATLRPHVEAITPAEKTRTLLVYGRPSIPRNAFYILEQGLKAWGAAHGAGRPDWRIVSAGLPHADIPLGGSQHLKALGKLGLGDYAALLRETALGLSLMVSPHPSYPPLEMAHFGARVLTNTYTDKDPAARHDNLVPLPGLRPEAIAAAIEAEMAGFEADPGRGLAAHSRMPDFLREDGISCAPELAADILAELSG